MQPKLNKKKKKLTLEEWFNVNASFMQRVMWFSGKMRHLNISKFDGWSHPLWSLWETKHRKLNYILLVFVFISIMWTFNGITSLRAEFSFIIWNSDGHVVGNLLTKLKHIKVKQRAVSPHLIRGSRGGQKSRGAIKTLSVHTEEY